MKQNKTETESSARNDVVPGVSVKKDFNFLSKTRSLNIHMDWTWSISSTKHSFEYINRPEEEHMTYRMAPWPSQEEF